MSEQKYLVTETQLTNIANAIRLQRDSTAMIEVDDMPMEIGLIDKDAFKITECTTFEGDVIADKYLESGAERAYTGWSISPYFNIFGAKVITFSYSNGLPQFRYCEFYDSSKVYISSLDTTRIQPFTLVVVPTGAKYIRTSGYSTLYTDGKGWIPCMLQREITVSYETYVYEFDVESDIGTTVTSVYSIDKYSALFTRLQSITDTGKMAELKIKFELTQTESTDVHAVTGFRLAYAVNDPDHPKTFIIPQTNCFVVHSDGHKRVSNLSGQMNLGKPTNESLSMTLGLRSDTYTLCVAGHYKVTILLNELS